MGSCFREITGYVAYSFQSSRLTPLVDFVQYGSRAYRDLIEVESTFSCQLLMEIERPVHAYIHNTSIYNMYIGVTGFSVEINAFEMPSKCCHSPLRATFPLVVRESVEARCSRARGNYKRFNSKAKRGKTSRHERRNFTSFSQHSFLTGDRSRR